MSAVTSLSEGALVLFPEGPRIVVAVESLGYRVRDVAGHVYDVPWRDVTTARGMHGNHVDGVVSSFAATWASLSEIAREQAWDRVEVVLTLLTGYALGHPALARPGEPFTDFDPTRKASMKSRIAAMSRQLGKEAEVDRRRTRALEGGRRPAGAKLGYVSPNTLWNWINAYQRPIDGGLLALVDGRRMRKTTPFDSLDPEIRRLVDVQLARMDGTISVPSADEICRVVELRLRTEGLTEVTVPHQTLHKYVSHKLDGIGATTRSHATRRLRGVTAYSSYPGLRPGQVVAIDVTWADNLVWDPWAQKAISVEVITAIDVASRVILALRVLPRSVTAFEAGMILYDVLRPFSMAISPERVDDWRWCGVPENVGLIDDAVAAAETLSGRPLVGEHIIPGVLPDAIRADNGSIFTSAHFRHLCEYLGVHLLLSRGKRPTDNSFVERWHMTIERALMQLAGYKGRNVSKRGSRVGDIKPFKIVEDERGRYRLKGDDALVTARELERYLREFVAADYHRSWHQGLNLIDDAATFAEAALRMTPLDMFDAMLKTTGRLHVLQRPDLVYDFLPIRWGTIQHDGVEFANLTFDSAVLDEFRHVPAGFFHYGDKKAPFFWDPNDASRVWFRHPTTDEIHEIPWRKKHLLRAPMTSRMLKVATSAVRKRGGNYALNSDSVQREILDVINDIGDVERLRGDADLADWQVNALIADAMRAQRSAYDHAEAAALTTSRGMGALPLRSPKPSMESTATFEEREFDPYRDPWPTEAFEDPSC